MAEERGEGWPVNGHMTHLNLETFGLLTISSPVIHNSANYPDLDEWGVERHFHGMCLFSGIPLL
jgi:hypothetical protein